MQLKVENLYAAYQKDIIILEGLNLNVAEGSIVIVIGPNGSGKSTLLKSICGILRPVKGNVFFDDNEITGITPSRIMQLGISYIPQERAIFPQMKVTENLEMGCWIFRNDRARVRRRIDWALDRFPVLKEKRRTLANSLSGGQQRLLDIAKSLLSNPSLLLVDEPTVGLSPRIAQDIYAELEALKDEGISILLVDQDVRAAMEIADEAYVLELGRVQSHGTRDEFEGQLGELVKSWLI